MSELTQRLKQLVADSGLSNQHVAGPPGMIRSRELGSVGIRALFNKNRDKLPHLSAVDKRKPKGIVRACD